MATNGCSPEAVRLSSMILYCVAAVIELICFTCIIAYTSSVCITARENSTRIWWSLNCIFPPILPDIAFAVCGFFFITHFYAPLGGVYNICMATLTTVAAIFSLTSVTGCGNPAQSTDVAGGVFGLIAGGLHIAITTLVAINLEGQDKIF